MKTIRVINAENNEIITDIKVRDNVKKIHDKVKKELSAIAQKEVKLLMQGKLDFATGVFDGHYLTLGTFKDIKAIKYFVIS